MINRKIFKHKKKEDAKKVSKKKNKSNRLINKLKIVETNKSNSK